MLPVLVAVKDRVRSRWSVLPYHREPEYVAVLGLADELVDAVIDDRDMADARAASLLGAIGAFIDSTYLPEQPDDQGGRVTPKEIPGEVPHGGKGEFWSPRAA